MDNLGGTGHVDNDMSYLTPSAHIFTTPQRYWDIEKPGYETRARINGLTNRLISGKQQVASVACCCPLYNPCMLSFITDEGGLLRWWNNIKGELNP